MTWSEDHARDPAITYVLGFIAALVVLYVAIGTTTGRWSDDEWHGRTCRMIDTALERAKVCTDDTTGEVVRA